MATSFTAIGMKATGSDLASAEIIELAATRFREGEVAAEFSLLVDPGQSIPRPVTRLTGIKDSDVIGKPSAREALTELAAFLEDEDTLVAHGDTFDAGLLTTRGAGEWIDEVVDILPLSRIVWPELNRHDPRSLAEALQVAAPKDRRAAAEAALAGNLWLAAREAVDELHPAVVQTISSLLDPLDSPLSKFFKEFDAKMAREAMLRKGGNYASLFADFTEYLDEIRARDESPPPEELQPLDVEKMGALFSDRSIFAKRLKEFEFRPQQVEMVRSICQAFNQGEHAVIEAGTGTGKSLAYMTPAIGWAILNRQRVVVSTNTRSLQDQLFEKDLPALRTVLKKDFKVVRLKGAANYLCTRRLLQVLEHPDRELANGDRLPLAALALWAARTPTGDLAECSGFDSLGGRETWAKLDLGGGECTTRSCREGRRCFLFKARGEAMRADIVVVNHALVFTDMGMATGILPAYHYAIFDEAHNMENVATENLARSVTPYRVKGLLDRLHQSDDWESGRGAIPQALYQVRKMQGAGGAKFAEIGAGLEEKLQAAINRVQQARAASQEFFRSAAEIAASNSGDAGGGGPRGAGRRPGNLSERLRYSSDTMDGPAWSAAVREGKGLAEAMDAVLDTLKNFADQLADSEDLAPLRRECGEELQRRKDELSELVDDLEFLLKAQDTGSVFWLERERGQREPLHSFQSAPIDIGPLLIEHLFETKQSIIMVSATLATGENFGFFRQRVGLDRLQDRTVQELQLGSCFDLESQALLALPSFLPEPDYREKDFGRQLGDLLGDVFSISKGRGLVLCTSYALLDELYPLLKDRLEPQSIPVLGQGIDGEAAKIAAVFKEESNSVLVGTQSFWEGFDAPGNTLCCVVVSKVPFPVFKDPIVEARCESLDARGLNSFMNYMVPSAAIRLKQGFGRLIRTKTDFGAVILADRRVLTRRYGRLLFRSLPVRHVEYGRWETMLAGMREFFEEKDGQRI